MENGKTALIIEDESALVFLLKQVLKTKGIDTIEASSIKEAYMLTKEMRPDFIFIDNDLPDGYGFDIISELHTIIPDAQIVAMTALDSYQYKEEAFKGGADYFLEKPFTIKQVYKSLKKELLSQG